MSENTQALKIKVEELSLVFGDQKKEALKLAEKGFDKAQILEKCGSSLAVDRVSLEIMKGEFFVIMGLSGSGKSTLLRCLNRLIEPTKGKVLINGQDITGQSDKQLLETRRTEMSMVFQNFGLLPHRNILENVAFGLELQGVEKQERLLKAKASIDVVGLNGYEDKFPHELSGGMQQRVGLARALANDPEVLLMDEAFSALDPLIRSEMQDELLDLQKKLNKTIVFITHDLDEAIKIGDRIAIMKDGKLVQLGTAEDILTNPADDYVEAFLEKVDRKTVITANTLMFEKFSKLVLGKHGIEGSIRKMRELGMEILPVTDENKKFKGFALLRDVLKAKKDGEKRLEEVLRSDVPSVYRSYTVEEMLPLITDVKYPLPVVHEESNKLLGIITQSSLIIEATSFEQSDINKLKEQANKQ